MLKVLTRKPNSAMVSDRFTNTDVTLKIVLLQGKTIASETLSQTSSCFVQHESCTTKVTTAAACQQDELEGLLMKGAGTHQSMYSAKTAPAPMTFRPCRCQKASSCKDSTRCIAPGWEADWTSCFACSQQAHPWFYLWKRASYAFKPLDSFGSSEGSSGSHILTHGASFSSSIARRVEQLTEPGSSL